MKKKIFIGGICALIALLLLRIVLSPTPDEYNKRGDSFYSKAEYKEAFKNYKKAAQKNNGYAYYKIGILLKRNYITYFDLKSDEVECFKNEETCFKKSAELNCQEGQNEIGKLYLEKKDYTNAFNFFSKAAEQGNMESATNLGKLYYTGLGIGKDIQKATYWFNLSKNSDEEAKFYLASIMLNENEITLDSIKAFQYLKDAANANFIPSYNYLGMCYTNGIGTNVDSLESSKWFLKGAKANRADAQYNLAKLLSSGIGVGIDKFEESFYWYLQSAGLGYDPAKDIVKNLHLSNIYCNYINKKYDIYYSDTISYENKQKILNDNYKLPPVTYREFDPFVRTILRQRSTNWYNLLKALHENPLVLKQSESQKKFGLMIIKAPVHSISSGEKYCELNTYYGLTFKSLNLYINLVNNECINEIYNIKKDDNVYAFGYISSINDTDIGFTTLCLSKQENLLLYYTSKMLYDIYCALYIDSTEDNIKLLIKKYGEYINAHDEQLTKDLGSIIGCIESIKNALYERDLDYTDPENILSVYYNIPGIKQMFGEYLPIN